MSNDKAPATTASKMVAQRKASSSAGGGGAAPGASGPSSPPQQQQQQHKRQQTSQQMVLSVQEETDDVVFSRDAQELLRRPSFSETLDKVQHTHRGWLRKLASNGRRWNRRFVVVHGHYLSYYKSENTSDVKNLMGALNLWRVESVTLDRNIIVVTLAPDVSVNNNSLLSRALLKKPMANRILLEAKDSKEASKWITTMNVTPFDASPTNKAESASLAADVEEYEEISSSRPSVAQAPTSAFKVKSVTVNVSKDRLFDFPDIAELSDTTRLRIGELNADKAEADVTVELVPLAGSSTSKKATVKFVPKDETAGTLRVPFEDEGEVQISWERDVEASIDELIQLAMAEDTPSSLLVPFAGGTFVVTWFIICIVLEFRVFFSTVVAGIVSGAAAIMLSSPPPAPRGSFYAANAPAGNRYVLTSVVLISKTRLSEPSVSLTAKVTEVAAAKRSSSSTAGEDVSILPEEKAKLVELRERLKGLRSPGFVEENEMNGKLDRILSDWHVDTSQSAISESPALVCEKYLDHDYRLVRFLRARSLNVDKAERMARLSLLWRMGVRADLFIKHFHPPRWIIEYGGASLFLKSIEESDFGTEFRLKNWWVRDRQGALSMFFRAGSFDWRKVSRKMVDATELMKVGIWALEVGRKDLDYVHEKTNGATPSYLTAVVDLESFSLTQQMPLTELIPIARRFFSVVATSFPELLKKVVVVNTPFLFNGIWQAIKSFIPEEVQNKIQIHGRCDIDKHLRPLFTDENIPMYLGGKLTGDDGDRFCTNRLPPAGPFRPDSGAELLKLPK